MAKQPTKTHARAAAHQKARHRGATGKFKQPPSSKPPSGNGAQIPDEGTPDEERGEDWTPAADQPDGDGGQSGGDGAIQDWE